jgi:hypothetical protein
MPSGEGMWLSRVRANLTHGSLGERWKRGSPAVICGFRVGVRWKATTMTWSEPSRRSTTTAPALYPTGLSPIGAIYSQVNEGVLGLAAYYLSVVLWHVAGETATVTSSMALKGCEEL